MKTKIIILISLYTTAVFAIITVPFAGWDWTKENSSDIIIARCVKAPPLSTTRFEPHSDIEVVMVLKGTNLLQSSVLRSYYLPQQGENYLIFSNYHDGSYQAIESYRVIPLGVGFSTNSIFGKPLDEQIQMLLQRRLDNLNRQMKDERAEKQRLEEGIKK